MADGPDPLLSSASQTGTRVKEKAVPKLLSLLSPVVHSWTVFARQIGIPASLISQIRAANPPAGRSYLYTCFTQALEWWVNNHRNPTYEAIIAILDPKRGQTTPVMNRTLARQVRKFMVKEQQGHAVKPPTVISSTHHGDLGGQGSVTEDDYADYTMRNLTIIKDKFECLRQNICKRLQDKLTERDVKDKLRPRLLTHIPREAEDFIPISTDLNEIFEAMRHHELWDHMNYFPLESLVDSFGYDDTEMIQEMEQFKRDRSSYQLATKIKQYIPVALSQLDLSDEPAEHLPMKRDPKYFRKLSVKLKQRVGDYSLKYLDRLWKSLADILLLPEPLCLLDVVLEKSILVVWSIPTSSVSKAIERASQNSIAFMNHPILNVTIADENVYDMKEEAEAKPSIFRDRFENLYLDVSMRLQENLTDDQIENDVWTFTKSLFPKESIPKVSDPVEIFEFFTNNQLWDCWNYFPLERIIVQFGTNDPEMKIVMEQYKIDLEQSYQTTTLNDKPRADIQGMFQMLLSSTCATVEKNLQKQQIKDNLRPFILSHLPGEAAKYIPNSSNLKDIFKAISDNKLWDCWNYFLVEVIVKRFSPEMTSQVEFYKKLWAEFQQTTKIRNYIQLMSEPAIEQPPSVEPKTERFTIDGVSAKENTMCFTKMSIQLPEHVADYPLMYLQRLWKSLSFHMLLPPTALLFGTVRSGSVFIEWLLPKEISPQAILQAHSSNYFYKSYQVLKVTIDEECVYEDESADDSKVMRKPGGYDCEYVDQPPELLETECPICVLIPREPYNTSCCGNSFCGSCIKRIAKDGMSCPLCNDHNFILARSKKLERELKHLEVRCVHRCRGCQWTGQLGHIEEHLNDNPDPDGQFEGCSFVQIRCIHGCGLTLERHMLAEHQNEECSTLYNTALSIHDLGDVWEAVFDSHRKWYEIGLKLKVSVDTLNSITSEHSNPKDMLRETIKIWLKTATKPTWQILIHALKSRTVNEGTLASTIEAKFFPMAPQAQSQETVQTLCWQDCCMAPAGMSRGAAVSHGNMAYFVGFGSTSVYAFNSEEAKWYVLPDCPHKDSSLVIAKGVLTAVGGKLGPGVPTNSLHGLTGKGRGKKWVENFPRMPTKRYCLTVVCKGRTLIAIGGCDGSMKLATVEILDTELLQWFIATSLPHPFSRAMAAICGDRLYLLGGEDQDGSTSSVFTCSISDLLQSLDEQLVTVPTNPLWHLAAGIPHYRSSCANLGGRVLAIGGETASYEKTSATVMYDPSTDSWQDVNYMQIARSCALVALLPGDRMIVIGGIGGFTAAEMATFKSV